MFAPEWCDGGSSGDSTGSSSNHVVGNEVSSIDRVPRNVDEVEDECGEGLGGVENSISEVPCTQFNISS